MSDLKFISNSFAIYTELSRLEKSNFILLSVTDKRKKAIKTSCLRKIKILGCSVKDNKLGVGKLKMFMQNKLISY